MPEFDDVIQPPHYRPQLDYNPMSHIERYTVLLKDGETTATIYPVQNTDNLPPGLLTFLCDEFNIEIERGDTFPFFDPLHIESFQNYWFGAFAGVMVLGDSLTLEGPKHWEKECLGTFFVKPNYPGRASHICTAGFLVNAGIRGKGIGRTLTDCFLQWAPRLGYTYCVFNLVFETNVAARSIWESLNFKRIGRIKSAGILKGHDTAVDALVYGRELVAVSESAMGAYRFDKIKYYLETGKYPAMADRQEKSRLRSSASHYRVEFGKLMLRDKEVISDTVRQLQICTAIHNSNHGGINKTTSAVAEKYHWTRIKDTVVAVTKHCRVCQELAKEEDVVKRGSILKRRLSSNLQHDNNGHNMGKEVTELRDIDTMGVLHHLPNRDTDTLLGHDLSNLDDGLIAVVEAAHKRQKTIQSSHLNHHHLSSSHQNHSSPATYAAVAAAAVGGQSNHPYYTTDYSPHIYSNKYDSRKSSAREDTVSVDPDVAAFENAVNAVNPEGDEIEIARALMQSSDEVDQHETHGTQPEDKPSQADRHEETNLFLQND